MGAFLAKITGRQGGKTHYLIKMLQANPQMVVIVPWQEMGAVYLQAGIHKDRILTPKSLDGLRGKRVPIAIDNMEMVLRDLLHLHDEDLVVTATGLTA